MQRKNQPTFPQFSIFGFMIWTYWLSFIFIKSKCQNVREVWRKEIPPTIRWGWGHRSRGRRGRRGTVRRNGNGRGRGRHWGRGIVVATVASTTFAWRSIATPPNGKVKVLCVVIQIMLFQILSQLIARSKFPPFRTKWNHSMNDVSTHRFLRELGVHLAYSVSSLKSPFYLQFFGQILKRLID